MKELNRRAFLTLTGAAVAMMALAACGDEPSRTSRTHYVQRSRAGGSHQQGLEGKVRCKGGCP